MVSFSCEVCNDTVIKKKLDQHRQRCHGAYFTCIDCSTTFNGMDYKAHTQCISEAEKYEKALYRGKVSKAGGKKLAPAKEANANIKVTEKPVNEVAEKSKKTARIQNDDKKIGGKIKKEKKSKNTSVDLSKYAGDSLSKALKGIGKDTKLDKKDLLKKLRLELVDGKPVLKL